MNCDRCGAKIRTSAGCLCSSPANGYSAPDWPTALAEALAERDSAIATIAGLRGELTRELVDVALYREQLLDGNPIQGVGRGDLRALLDVYAAVAALRDKGLMGEPTP